MYMCIERLQRGGRDYNSFFFFFTIIIIIVLFGTRRSHVSTNMAAAHQRDVICLPRTGSGDGPTAAARDSAPEGRTNRRPIERQPQRYAHVYTQHAVYTYTRKYVYYTSIYVCVCMCVRFLIVGQTATERVDDEKKRFPYPRVVTSLSRHRCVTPPDKTRYTDRDNDNSPPIIIIIMTIIVIKY